MPRSSTLAAFLALLLLASAPAVALGQAPPGPTSRVERRVEGVAVAGPMEVAHLLQEFAPGAWTPPHTHPGQAVVTVLEGAITRRHAGQEATFRTGEGWVEAAGEVHQAGNATAAPAVAIVTYLLPAGAPTSTPQPGGAQPAPPAPIARHEFRAAAPALAGPFDVAHEVADFAPGARTSLHTHPSLTMVTVMAGELTVRLPGRQPETLLFKAGESATEPPATPIQGSNAGGAPTAILVTLLAPRGAALSTPVAEPGGHAPGHAPGMPRTGEGVDAAALIAGAAALGAAGLLAAGGLAWRRRRAR